MKKNILILKKLSKNRYFIIFVFLLVFYFTFVIRVHNYDRVPTANHVDEMLYAWSGLYLIETGTPVSWSALDYPKRAEFFRGNIQYKGGKPETGVILYKPWLDEPPLFSLLVGYFAHQYGADRTQFVPSSYIRIPTVLAAAIVSIFIFLIARFVSGYWTGILAMLIYGTTPILVFGARTAMPENIIALMFIIMIYLFLHYLKTPKFLYLLPMPFMIGIAGLSKPTGFFLLPFALFLAFVGYYRGKTPLLDIEYHKKNFKKALLTSGFLIGATLPFIAGFFLYGLYFDPEIFWKITSIQAHRPVGFGGLAWFFISPGYDINILKDSWFVFLLLSAAFFIFKPEPGIKKLISFSFVYWIIIVLISGGETDMLAWYRFTAYPLLAILGAWGIEYLFKRADFFASFFVVGMLLGNRLLLANPFRPNVQPQTFRYVFSALLAPSLLQTVFDANIWKVLSKTIIVGVIILGMWWNTIFIYNAFELICEGISCPIVPSTSLSSMHFPFIWRFFVLGEPTYK